tara:strand:- start:74 stop:244 length:171 start_codon:yes stop_codon:yes gene_type:complete
MVVLVVVLLIPLQLHGLVALQSPTPITLKLQDMLVVMTPLHIMLMVLVVAVVVEQV